MTHGNVRSSTISVALRIVLANVLYFFGLRARSVVRRDRFTEPPPRVSYSGAKSTVHNRKIRLIARLRT